jgi:hypothetical protein
MAPEWTILNLVIQSIAGIIGAHIAAIVAHEHRFGFIGHTAVGLIAGVLSGCFLQQIVMTTVDVAGAAMPMTALETGIYQAVAGLAFGGMAMLVVGVLRVEMSKKT